MRSLFLQGAHFLRDRMSFMLRIDGNGNGKGNYHIIQSLRELGDASSFTVCEPELTDDASLLDALHGKLLTRLSLMRDICVKVIDLPMTNRERGECQERVERLIAEIDKLASSIGDVARGDASNRAAILREVGTVDESSLTIVNRVDAIEGDEKKLRRHAPPMKKDVSCDPKFDAWMKSLLRDQ